jgi:hypothetical protein
MHKKLIELKIWGGGVCVCVCVFTYVIHNDIFIHSKQMILIIMMSTN